MVKFVIPLDGTGERDDPFRPRFLEEAPPGIHYDLVNGVAVFDPEAAEKAVKALKAKKEIEKVLLDKVKKAAKELEKLAEEGKVEKIE